MGPKDAKTQARTRRDVVAEKAIRARENQRAGLNLDGEGRGATPSDGSVRGRDKMLTLSRASDTNVNVDVNVRVDVDLGHEHHHGPGCGHYNYGGGWHDYDRHHSHHYGCGHHYYNNYWYSFPSFHVHGIGCGHFFGAGIWLSFGGSHHSHHAGCGHYYWGGLWHGYSSYHRHYSGCGHYNYGGYWHDFDSHHVHGYDCGHYYDGARWHVYGYGGHVHGSGCGHYYYSSRWHIYPQRYYHRHRGSSFYFFVDLGSYEDRHVPSYVSDYQRRYADESLDVFDAEDHLSSAYANFADQRYYRSLFEFDSAIEEDPDDGLLYFARAQAYLAVGDYRSAYEDILVGMDNIPDWTDLQFTMTELYGDPEEFSAQLDGLERWVDDHPKDYMAHMVLGYVYYFLQEYELAKSELVYTLAFSPELPQVETLLDAIYNRQLDEDLEAHGDVVGESDDPLEEKLD